jgi:methenyltetrahydromethanopterin cyclohydrolase
LSSLAGLNDLIITRYGLSPQNAQFVDVYGSTHCRPLVPCMAFEQNATNFLLSVDDLFVITAGSRRALSMDSSTLGAVEQSLAGDEAVISLGAEAWAVGRKVVPLQVH